MTRDSLSLPLEPPPPPALPPLPKEIKSGGVSSALTSRIREIGVTRPQVKEPLSKEHVVKWKSFETPTSMGSRRLHVDLSSLPPDASEEDKRAVELGCRNAYRKANEESELDVGAVALSFVSEPDADGKVTKGPLLRYANTLSRRYLDLHEALAQYDIAHGIPMIASAAGFLKAEGLTTQEILALKTPAQRFTEILEDLKKPFTERAQNVLVVMSGNKEITEEQAEELKRKFLDTKSRKQYLETLANKEKRTDLEERLFIAAKKYDEIMTAYETAVLKLFSDPTEQEKFLKSLPASDGATATIVEASNKLKGSFSPTERALLTKVFQKLDRHGYSIGEIEVKLSDAANLVTKAHATVEERVLMEIRHRVCDEQNEPPTETGVLGQNPLAYVNIITQGEPGNPEAEFRNQLTFVYKSKHLANEMLMNKEFSDFANKFLGEKNKGWSIDPTFVQVLSEKGRAGPVFNYGQQAKLASVLRSKAKEKETALFYKTHPRPSYEELLTKPTRPTSSLFQYDLTARELMALTGERPDEVARKKEKVPFLSGSTTYHLRSKEEVLPLPDSAEKKAALEYLEMVQELELPTTAGISGTYDSSMVMAGLVGLGLGIPPGGRQEQEDIRLAYIGFFVPARHHTVHEVMQSSKSYGLPYEPGPGSESQIYPHNKEVFLTRLETRRRDLGHTNPSYYLSAEYALSSYQKLRKPK